MTDSLFLHLFYLTWSLIAGVAAAHQLAKPRDTVFQRAVDITLFCGALVVWAIGLGVSMTVLGRAGK